ncbi:MAG: hypothetical protein R3B83_02975 [Nitrospirales bacterium]|nr:hypothetical protein [Nitrospirales bacterium]
MHLDQTTLRNLEVFSNPVRTSKGSTLLQAMDYALTPWAPDSPMDCSALTQVARITERQEAIQSL